MRMEELEEHEMQLQMTYRTGVEEWYCPTCGRCLLLQWSPIYKRVVLEPGDEYVIHTGGKGGFSTGIPQVASEEGEFAEELLNPWEDWLRDVDL